MFNGGWRKSENRGLIPMLNKWGTIQFSTAQMRQLIGFGTPIFEGIEFKGFQEDSSVLDFSIWLDFVPRVYREQCTQICLNFPFDKIERLRCDDSTKEIIIRHLQQAIIRDVKPV